MASSHFALVFTAGVAMHIGLLNLWFWRTRDARGRDRAHLWVAVFCFASVCFQITRYGVLYTDNAETALLMARLGLAVTPLLGASLIFFGWALRHRSWKRWQSVAFVAGNLAISYIGFSTDVFFSNEVVVRQDWFGRDHFEAVANPALVVFIPYVIGLLVAISRDIQRAGTLSQRERHVILWSFSIYAALALQSAVSALDWISMPSLLEYGPIAVAVGLNHLLVDRHRRLQSELEAMVCERTDALMETNAELAGKLGELIVARDEAGEANAQLSESRARYRNLVENAPLGVLACDRDGFVTMVNSHLMKMVGAPTAEYTGVKSLFDMPSIQQAGMAGALKRCVEEGNAETFEASFTAQSYEKTSVVRIHLAALRDPDGNITGAQALVEDIAERLALEAQVQHSQKMEAIGGLAAGIAHEINNPMAYVRANLTMLQEEAAGALKELSELDGTSDFVERLSECNDLIGESLEGVNRTIAIVRDVKEFSHMGEAPSDSVDVNEILKDCLRVAESQLPPEVDLQCSWGEAPELRCNPSRLRQVFLNLIMNAGHAVAGSGFVKVESLVEGSELCVRVKDNGCGIPEEVRPRIFEPFFTTKQAGEGTGLGLYISYELVRQQKGTICVDSLPGGGTVFEVRLPL